MPPVSWAGCRRGGGVGAELPVTRVDPACAYRFADGTEMQLPHDAARIPSAIDAALGPGTGESWRGLHERSRRLWNLVSEPVLRQPISLSRLARMSIRPA